MIDTIPVLLKLPSSHGRFNEVVQMISASLRKQRMTFKFAPIGSKNSIRNESRRCSSVVLDEQDLINIYPHLPTIILNAQIAQFAHKALGLWIVEGDGAIATVAYFKGCQNDPAKCASHTWRFRIAEMLGGSRSMTLRGMDGKPEITVFDNFIHAPKREEVDRDMAVLQKFI